MPKQVVGAYLGTIGPEDYDALGIRRAPLAQFIDRDRLGSLKREKDALKEEKLRVVAARDDELNRRDPRLRPDVLREQRKEIVARHQVAIDRIDRRAGEIADEVKGATGYWSRSEVLRRSRFADDEVAEATVRNMWTGRIGRASDASLLGFAKQAISERNVALVGVISEELAARPDLDRSLRREIGAVLNTIRTEAEELGPLLGELQNARYELLAVDGNARSKIAAGLASRGASMPHPEPRAEDKDEDGDDETDEGEDAVPPPGLVGGQISIHKGLLARRGSSGAAPEQSDNDADDNTGAPTGVQRISEGLRQRKQRIADNKE